MVGLKFLEEIACLHGQVIGIFIQLYLKTSVFSYCLNNFFYHFSHRSQQTSSLVVLDASIEKLYDQQINEPNNAKNTQTVENLMIMISVVDRLNCRSLQLINDLKFYETGRC